MSNRAQWRAWSRLLSRRGETVVDTIGCQDLVRKDPIRRDTIFRIASMTKPITAVAAMILVEECRLTLDAPLDALLPELANRRVLKRIDGPLDETEAGEPPAHAARSAHLPMGLGMIMGPPGAYPIQQAMDASSALMSLIRPAARPDEWLRRLGRCR